MNEQLTSFQELMTDAKRGQVWTVLDAVQFIDQLAENDLLWHFDDDARDCFSQEQASDVQCYILQNKANDSRDVLGDEALFHLAIDYNELFARRRGQSV